MQLKKSSKNANLKQELLDGIVGENGTTVRGFRVTSNIHSGSSYNKNDSGDDVRIPN